MTMFSYIRKSLLLSPLILIGVLADSCKEVNPVLTAGKHNVLSDTTYVESPVQTADPKVELIEMFTGVSCINCPAAHTVLDNIISAHSDRVIGVALHSTAEPASQDNDPPYARQQLGSADAQAIISHFGEPGARPVGSVDRVSHTGTFGVASVYDIAANWGGYTNTQLALTSPVNIVLSNTSTIDSISPDSASRKLAIAVELHYTAAQADSDKLSIFLTEDSIVTSQLQSDNSNDQNYVHNGVLRAAVTDPLGDRINAKLTPGTVVRKIYIFEIPRKAWRLEHMNIIAFVHRYQGSDEILQARTIRVQ